MQLVSFFAPGRPVPQGSMVSFGNGMRHSNSKELKLWRETIATAAALNAAANPIDSAVTVGYMFVFNAPKSRAKKPFNKAGWIPRPVKPDLDKLIRAANDAISASVKGGAPLLSDDDVVWEIANARKIEIPNPSWDATAFPRCALEQGLYVEMAVTDLEMLAPIDPAAIPTNINSRRRGRRGLELVK